MRLVPDANAIHMGN